MADNDKHKDVDRLLRNISEPPKKINTLKDFFERRVAELKVSPTTVMELLNMEYRTLHGILEAKQKRVDFTNLIKIATFLQLSLEEVIQLYVESLERSFPAEPSTSPEKMEFIKENFDLAQLRKAGFIDSITDFVQIEQRILFFLGLKTITDYKRPPVEVAAFSAGKVKPKNELTRSFWIKAAEDVVEALQNPNEFNREALIAYFPEIRWHTTSVEIGFTNVIKALFKMGVTVIFQPSFSSLHLHGATFEVRGKPAIALTNYKGFYPTLWFALVHELFHVLFDWEEIKEKRYHFSEEESDQLSVNEKEGEANNFAREYLFSKEKTEKVRPHLYNEKYVESFTINNHVHPSFFWVFNAVDATTQEERKAWIRARRYNPDKEFAALLQPLTNAWNNPIPISDFVKSIEYKFYK